jgi:hypothetical protein
MLATQLNKPSILWKRGAIWLALLGPFFFLSYGWVNYFTSGRTDVGVMVEAWERQLPFVPWLMLPYMSIDAFYAASLFLFRKRSALDRHAYRLLLATVISLIGFLLYPLQFSFEVPKADGFNGMLQAILMGFDKPYNQAPSLHISLLIVLWELYAKRLQGFMKVILHVWFFAIAASVLLVYQHHFIDVWTGALAGVICLYLIPDQPFSWRWQRPTVRMKHLALRYGLSATLSAFAALFAHQVSDFLTAIFIWTAIALLLVALAYSGFEQHAFQRDHLTKRRGHMRWPAKFLLAPYLFLSWLSYRRYTKEKYLPNKIHGNVWLGAFPRKEVAKMSVSWHGILDLTNEFPAVSFKAPNHKYLPVLDLTPPKPATLVKAVRWLERTQQQGDVLVHCALGMSRSASVVACWLVWRRHAANIQEAIAKINAIRTASVLSIEHEENITEALKCLGQTEPSTLTRPLSKPEVHANISMALSLLKAFKPVEVFSIVNCLLAIVGVVYSPMLKIKFLCTLVILIGLGVLYFAMRIRIDRTLFERWDSLDIAALDEALLVLNPKHQSGRALALRLEGSYKLFNRGILAISLQLLMLVQMIWSI